MDVDMKNSNITIAKIVAFPVVFLAAVFLIVYFPIYSAFYLIYEEELGREKVLQLIVGAPMTMLSLVLVQMENPVAKFLGIVYASVWLTYTTWPLVPCIGKLYNKIYYGIFDR